MFDARAIGLECIKLGFFGSWFAKDNPKSRVLRNLIGDERIQQMDSGVRGYVPDAITPSFWQQQQPAAATDVPADTAEIAAPDVAEAQAPTPSGTEGHPLAESNEESAPNTPNQLKAPDTDVTPQDMIETPQGEAHAAMVDPPDSAFGEPPDSVVKQSSVELRSEAADFKPQDAASFQGVEPSKQRSGAEVRRDQEHAAEPPRQEMNNDFIDMIMG